MDKSQLRKKYIEIRKNIADKDKKSHDIFMKTSSLPCLKEAKTIALYSSLPSEVNTSELIDCLIKSGKKICLPKVMGDDMEFYCISGLEDITQRGSFGIYEPPSDDRMKLDPEKLDIIIMPGVCFDKSGNRIGFGKGYYDRYLSGLEKIYKIALCFEEQLLSGGTIASEDHDIRADIIVTDKCIYAVNGTIKS